MNDSRRLFSLVSALSLVAISAQAGSLYSGLAAQTARPQARQAVLPPAALTALPASPVLAAKLGLVAPAAVAATAAGAPATALGAVQSIAAAVPAAGAAGDPAVSLNAAFDQAALRQADDFVERAIGFFHPTLPSGLAPAVAAKVTVKPQGVIPSDDEMNARMALSPLTNPEREAAVIKLYQMGGAAAQIVDVPARQSPRLDLFDVVQRQDAGKGRHNLIIVKKGKTDKIVIVGAHHDKVHEGAGTIDNWTGATMVTNLYQAMKDVDTDATFVFIAFSREEEGLLGSQFFVDSLSKTEKARIASMVNLDTLGVDGTMSWGNNGTRWMLDRVMQVATAAKLALKEIRFWGGDADSSTFLKAKIPAFTLLGASEAVIWDIIHSANDTMAAFNLAHYRNAYLLTLALLEDLAQRPGNAAAIN